MLIATFKKDDSLVFWDALEVIFKNYIKILFGRCVESGLVKVNDNEVDVDYRQGAGTTLN